MLCVRVCIFIYIFFYYFRMGSFTSAPKIPNEDTADNDVEFSSCSNWKDLLARCEAELVGWPKSISRSMVVLEASGDRKIRVMQWNILAQGKL